MRRRLLDRQTQNLGRILDDLLEMSRVTRGKLELRKQRLALGQVCQHAADAARDQIQRKQQRLEVVGPDAEVWGDADTTRIEQILWNLLTNASKYTPVGGRISLSVGTEAGDAIVRVRDTGRGMDEDYAERAFELFAQAGVGEGGLGLGLPLSRNLAQLHGGSLTGHSEGPGRGSEFELRLPAVQAPSFAQADPGSQASPPRRRVLVVEDQPDLAWTMARLLEVHSRCMGTRLAPWIRGPRRSRSPARTGPTSP